MSPTSITPAQQSSDVGPLGDRGHAYWQARALDHDNLVRVDLGQKRVTSTVAIGNAPRKMALQP